MTLCSEIKFGTTYTLQDFKLAQRWRFRWNYFGFWSRVVLR